MSWLHPFKEQKLIAVGDRAIAVFDDLQDWDKKLQLYPHSVEWRDGLPTPKMAAAEPVRLEQQEPLANECRHFVECVGTSSRPRTDGREGMAVLRVLDAAERSTKSGTVINLEVVRQNKGETHAWRAHETACIDDNVSIGDGTQIWHFSHILSGSTIGRDCSIGQNVVIGPDVRVGDRCKIQKMACRAQIAPHGGIAERPHLRRPSG